MSKPNRLYKSVREYLEDEEDSLMFIRIFHMTQHRLGLWKEAPPELWDAVVRLLERPSDDFEEYVLFTSYTLKEDDPWPAGAIYVATDAGDSAGLEIAAWDALREKDEGTVLGDELVQKLFRLTDGERQELFRDRKKLPCPVVWEQINNPLDILVNSPKAASYILAWCLRDQFRGKWAYMPCLLEPVEPEKMGQQDLYADFSRYAQLKKSATAFLLDNATYHVRREIREITEELDLDEEYINRLLDDEYEEKEEE